MDHMLEVAGGVVIGGIVIYLIYWGGIVLGWAFETEENPGIAQAERFAPDGRNNDLDGSGRRRLAGLH